MSRVLIDKDLMTKLGNLAEPLELVDSAGRVLAQVTPTVDLSQFQPWEPAFDEEELRRLEQSNQKRYTTAEVLAHLEKL
jgi:hypothetical protein